MATLKDYRDERLRKLEELKALGINPYPARSQRTHYLNQITDDFTELEGKPVSVVGRITNIRKFGKIAFIVVRDKSGIMQLFLRGGVVEGLKPEDGQLGLEQLPLLDSGDFIEAQGNVIKTQTGEISVEVRKLRLLTKALRPMPNAQDGFTNKEERFRRRYVDTNVNHDVYERFLRRSRFWQSTRDFLNTEGFVEMSTPVLELTTGGADANPFVTHMDALGQDYFLRISHELPLKRLLVGGYEKVFDIGPRFRNENYSDEHLPEHNAMEWYWAYADWEKGMELTERMVRYVADKTWGTRQFTLPNGSHVDLGPDGERWPRVSFVDVIREQYGLDVFACTLEEVKEQLKKHNLEVEKQDNRARGIDKLWKKIRTTIDGPAFLVDIPTFLQPLAKTQPGKPELTEQFNLLLGGSELCKAYSELNDPIDQLNRFLEQQAMRDAGDDEAQMLDIDYVEALEYAMPPACGLGYSERVFWYLEGVTAREGVIFPQLRREIDEVTKGIYPQVHFDVPNGVGVQKDSTNPTSLPISAAEQGTRKLYLDDYELLACDATVLSVVSSDAETTNIVLDQTCMYPGGGGQACDLGDISWEGGRLHVTAVSKDYDGVIVHSGVLQGDVPVVTTSVHVRVDAPRRLLNSRLHSAGHLIDYAVRKLRPDWKPGKGSHFPGRCSVEYEGTLDTVEAETIGREVESILSGYMAKGGSVKPMCVPSSEAHNYSDYLPQAILDAYQNVYITTYPDNFAVCCGGTHIADVSEIGQVVVTKIKKKNGNIRVSYEVA